jgi:nucleoside-diphosphate kinase
MITAIDVMVASDDSAITTIGHIGVPGVTAIRPVGRGGNSCDGSGELIENVAVLGSTCGMARGPAWLRAAVRGPATGRSFTVRLPRDGRFAAAWGRPVRSAARSVLQCLQRPATGWMAPPHTGQGIRASGRSDMGRLTMLPRLDSVRAHYRSPDMAIERTFSIIKPDAVAKNVIGQVTAKLEGAGLRILASKMVRLTEAQARGFYAVHKDRPFYNDLVKFMTEGPVVVQVLEGEGAIAKNREVMGATNPEKAAAGTIRKDFATNIERNAVHGSDAPETAREEIAFFFSAAELASLAR